MAFRIKSDNAETDKMQITDDTTVTKGYMLINTSGLAITDTNPNFENFVGIVAERL